MTQQKQVDILVNEFLETGKTVENIRDIWYQIKHDAQLIENSDSDWAKKVTEMIGESLYKLFLGGDIEVYNRLNIVSRGMPETLFNGTPIVIFSEKVTRATINASKSLNCQRYSSSGQLPKFEEVQVAFFIEETATETGLVYLIGMVDYDPAGLSIFYALAKKVEECLTAINPDLILFTKLVTYGVDYEPIIEKYDSYELGEKYKPNEKWFREGHYRGVEMNVIDDKEEHLEKYILKIVNPQVVKEISRSRLVSLECFKLETANEDLVKLEEDIEGLKQQIRDEVEARDTSFSGVWGELTSLGVREMTKFA